jgi:predicted RNA-binding Zn-ribbon protein involved in translation (DUF1610 family)
LKQDWRWRPRSAIGGLALGAIVAVIGIAVGHRLVFIIMQAVENRMPYQGAIEVALTVVYAKLLGLWSPAMNVYAPLYILPICWLSPWRVSRLGVALIVALAVFYLVAPYPYVLHMPPGGAASHYRFFRMQTAIEIIGAPVALWILTGAWRVGAAVMIVAIAFRSVHHLFMAHPPFGGTATWPYQVVSYGYHVALFGVLIAWLVAGWRFQRRLATGPAACARCGYQIAGLAGTGVALCPECGEPITNMTTDQRMATAFSHSNITPG